MVHLDYLLKQSFADKEYVDQLKWLVEIFRWLRSSKDSDKLAITQDRLYSAKLKYLLQLLSRNPEWQANFVDTITAVLKKMSTVNLFTDAGMSLTSSFSQELLTRLEDKILPKRFYGENLSVLLLELFPDEEDSILVDNIDEKVFSEILDLFKDQKDLVTKITSSINLSLDVMATQLLANTFTLHREVFAEAPDKMSWPQYHLTKLISASTEQTNLNDQDQWTFDKLNQAYQLTETCEKSLNQLLETMKDSGIKLDCVFLIESQRRRLERIGSLLILLDPKFKKAPSVRLFISTLILNLHHQKSLRSFFRENLGLLSNQIILKNSNIGEHYAVFNWNELKHLYWSALGGGALTSITVFVKLIITSLGFSGFIKGFLEGLNYAGSFLGIQILGFTLATKQPSTTAPYLSKALDASVSEAKTAVLAVLRAQIVSVIGNLSLVFPICFFVSWISYSIDLGSLSVSNTESIVSSLNIAGPSSLFAAFTGVLLFSASLIAGWFENWSVVHNLSGRIQNNEKIQTFLGAKKTVRLSEFFKKHSNSLAANISLGMLLGLTPQFVKFLGIPIEVRHITLATGQLAAALPTLISTENINWPLLASALLGLVLIGTLNIAVSFGLALTLAGISSKRKLSLLWEIIKWGLWTIVRHPQNLFPSRTSEKNPH